MSLDARRTQVKNMINTFVKSSKDARVVRIDGEMKNILIEKLSREGIQKYSE